MPHDFTTQDVARFNSKIDKSSPNGCWEWTAGAIRNGYGRFKLHGKDVLAHRVAYKIYVGDIPDGLFVCHSCDNPRCCNPAHLWLGTNADNTKDMVEKGRCRSAGPRGEQNGMSRLTKADVLEIKSKRAYGTNQYVLAKEYGVSQSLISLVCSGKVWSHVE